CLNLRDITSMVKEMKIFLNYIIPSRSNEIVLFVTAGLFGYVTSDTPFGEYVDNIWINIAGVSMFLTIILTILFVALFSFIGVHQIVTISIILSSVTYYDIGVNNIVMASILLSAYAIGAMVSPVSPANIMISTLLNENIYKIIIRWNFIYAILLVFVHALAIYMFFLW